MTLIAAAAQVSEDFEATAFPPEGWKVDHLLGVGGNNNGWERVAQPAGNVNSAGGSGVARSRVAEGRKDADSWLISPAFDVAGECYLNFSLLATTMTLPQGSFNVMVSPTGSDSRESFTETVLTIEPRETSKWADYSVDLSRWKGKKIRVAFRHVLMAPTSFGNRVSVFIDNVRVSDTGVSDLTVTSIDSPRNHCSGSQTPVVKVTNTGVTATGSVCVQVEGGEVLRQESTRFPMGDTVEVVFAKPLLLEPGKTYTVKAWTECDADANSLNNEMTSSAVIYPRLPFPYDMSASSTPQTDLKAINMTTGSWKYMQNNVTEDETWVYDGATGSAVLAIGGLDLPSGYVRLGLDYALTQPAIVKVLQGVFPAAADLTEVVAESDVLVADGAVHHLTLAVPTAEGGPGALALQVYSPTGEPFACINNGDKIGKVQMVVDNITVAEAIGDIALEAVEAPRRGVFVAGAAMPPLSVKVRNLGPEAVSAVRVAYKIDDNEAVEDTVAAAIAPGEAVVHPFASVPKAPGAGTHTLTLFMNTADSFDGNNTLTKDFRTADPQKLPFNADFEEGEAGLADWDIVSADQDLVSWNTTDQLFFSGKSSMALSCLRNMNNDDWLISPPLTLEKGAARVAFYYAMTGDTSDGALEVYLTDSRDLPADAVPLKIFEGVTDGWTSVAVPFKVPADGTYFIALRGRGHNAFTFVDRVAVDTGADMAMTEVSFGEKSHYNLTESDIIATFVNQGSKIARDITVSYILDGEVTVTETYSGPLAPGASFSYTFRQPADLSAVRIHTVKASVTIDGDSDPLNNTMVATHEHYKNKTAPYFQNFENATQRARWSENIVDANGDGLSWIVAGNASMDAYSGSGCLYYNTVNAKEKGDDWIFSECLDLEAGVYDLSFFYRTYKNFAKRTECFTVMLGQEPTPEAMTLTVADFDQISVPDSKYPAQYLTQLTLDAPGKWYIGFHATSDLSQGYLLIDDVKLAERGELPPFYESDFSNRFSEWTPYDPAPNRFDSWSNATEEGREGAIAALKTFRIANEPAILASPAFKIGAGETVEMEIEYKLVTTNEADRLAVVMGQENARAALVDEIASLEPAADWTTVTIDVPARDYERCVFAFKPKRAARDKDVEYKVGRVTLTPKGLGSFALTGSVADENGRPVGGVAIALKGGRSQYTVTDSEGKFRFESVLERQPFVMTLSKSGYIDVSRDVTLDGNALDLGTIEMAYLAVAPAALSASLDDESGVVTLEWLKPGFTVEYRHDDGRAVGSAGMNQGGADAVVGSVFRDPCRLSACAWQTMASPATHPNVNLYVLDLDPETGEPTGNILYSVMGVPNVDNDWTRYEFPEPVNAPNGLMIALSYDTGSVNLALDDGIDDYPFSERTCYMGYVSQGEFEPIENRGGASSFLVRAFATPLSAGPRAPRYTDEADGEKSPLSYEVFRFAEADTDNETLWTLITTTEVPSATDAPETLEGMYCYGVRAVYSPKTKSESIVSEPVELKKRLSLNDAGEVADAPVVTFDRQTRQLRAVNAVTLEIWSVDGRLVRKLEGNNGLLESDMSGLYDGVYIARAVNASGAATILKF